MARTEPGSADVEANKQRSRRLYEELFGRGNYDAADEILAPDYMGHGGSAGSPPTTGTAGIKQMAALQRSAFPDLRVILNRQVAEADHVTTHWTASGTHQGTLNLTTGTAMAIVEPTGKTISWDEIRIDRYVDGRIAESWYIPDRMTYLQQLGLLPAMTPPRRAK